ncbi:molecular chaperone, partial [Citrobacter portucalensis]|nr:molecular chaperone [Citrobacter portucalensis]
NNELDIYNPSAYHVVFAGLALGKTDLTNKIDYIAPGEHKRLAVPAAAGKTVRWAAINDYGGTTKTETQTLQ